MSNAAYEMTRHQNYKMFWRFFYSILGLTALGHILERGNWVAGTREAEVKRKRLRIKELKVQLDHHFTCLHLM